MKFTVSDALLYWYGIPFVFAAAFNRHLDIMLNMAGMLGFIGMMAQIVGILTPKFEEQ